MEDSALKLAIIQGSSENFFALHFKYRHKRKGKMYLKNLIVVTCGSIFSSILLQLYTGFLLCKVFLKYTG